MLNRLVSACASSCPRARTVTTFHRTPSSARSAVAKSLIQPSSLHVVPHSAHQGPISPFYIQKRFIRWAKPKLVLGNQRGSESSESEIMDQLVAKYREALVIDEDGTNLGVMTTRQAYNGALQRGKKMVLVRDSVPPVFRYQEKLSQKEKREKERAKKDEEKLHEKMKEMRITDKITEHDLTIKITKAVEHLKKRHRVKVNLVFKKKSEFNAALAQAVMDNVSSRLTDYSDVETPFRVNDDFTAFLVLRPIARKTMIAKGLMEEKAPINEEQLKSKQRKQLNADRERLLWKRRQELEQQGVIFRRYISPEEQFRIATSAGGNGDFMGIDDFNPEARRAALKEKPKGGPRLGPRSVLEVRRQKYPLPKKAKKPQQQDEWESEEFEEDEEYF